MRTGRLLALMMSLALLVSCQREHLYYASSDTATVQVKLDWEAAGLIPNGATVFAYWQNDGSLYKRFDPFSNAGNGYITLPQGDFTLLAMNDTPEEFEGYVGFVGMDNLNTIQAVGVKDPERTKRMHAYLQTKADPEDVCIIEPDTLAVAIIKDVHVTTEDIDYFYDKPEDNVNEEEAMVLAVEPKPVFSRVNIRAHVTGLKYAQGTTLSFLRGTAAGTYLGTGINRDDQVSQAFILNNRTYDEGSDSDGTISASFLSFGLAGSNAQQRYYLDINFILVNGESYPLTYDVTDALSVDVELSLHLQLNLNLEIELPEAMGNGEDDGAFSTDVNPWVDIVTGIEM